VPYPFAHPVAVLPLVRPMGRFAVPSALVIGSIAPDLWYFAPFLTRHDSHSIAALFWFCLPLGVATYLAFHVLLKQPLIALLSPKLGSFTCAGLPRVRWYAVIVSLFVGALTHLVWDGLTHSNDHVDHGHNWLQHVNTAVGTAILAWWIWHKLRRAPAAAPEAGLSPLGRTVTMAALVAAMGIAAWWSLSAGANPADMSGVRQMLRAAGSDAVLGLSLVLFVYCALWRLRKKG
jgi:uncharacterized protein DUF4184